MTMNNITYNPNMNMYSQNPAMLGGGGALGGFGGGGVRPGSAASGGIGGSLSSSSSSTTPVPALGGVGPDYVSPATGRGKGV